MAPRTSLMNSGSMIEESVSAGRMRCSSPSRVSSPVSQRPRRTVSPRPKAGSQPSQTEKMVMRKMPVRKTGIEMPSTLKPRIEPRAERARADGAIDPGRHATAAARSGSRRARARSLREIWRGRRRASAACRWWRCRDRLEPRRRDSARAAPAMARRGRARARSAARSASGTASPTISRKGSPSAERTAKAMIRIASMTSAACAEAAREEAEARRQTLSCRRCSGSGRQCHAVVAGQAIARCRRQPPPATARTEARSASRWAAG